MNKKDLKLNVLLAVTDHLASSFKKGLEDYVKFFKGSQGAFKGEKNTYSPRAGVIDDPSARNSKLVVTTVDEKLDWLKTMNKEYIDALFSQEKTNSSGVAKTKLVIDGIHFGEFTSLELLRLKTLLESATLKDMYENIPVRTEDENWSSTSNPEYKNKNVFETEMRAGVKKTTVKEAYILPDPNLDKLDKGTKYTPMLAQRDTIMELGDYTHQKFSGEWSHLERANVLARRTKMLTAVIEALKVANEVPVVASEMTSEKFFNYLHKGSLE
jgi:hypothetical protein